MSFLKLAILIFLFFFQRKKFFLASSQWKQESRSYKVSFIFALKMVSSESWKRLHPNYYAHDSRSLIITLDDPIFFDKICLWNWKMHLDPFWFTMRKELLNLYPLVWVHMKLLKFVKNIRFLLNFSKNFSLYSSDFLNLYFLVSIIKNVMFYAFGLVYSY